MMKSRHPQKEIFTCGKTSRTNLQTHSDCSNGPTTAPRRELNPSWFYPLQHLTLHNLTRRGQEVFQAHLIQPTSHCGELRYCRRARRGERQFKFSECGSGMLMRAKYIKHKGGQ